jgi:hypothetical protein
MLKASGCQRKRLGSVEAREHKKTLLNSIRGLWLIDLIFCDWVIDCWILRRTTLSTTRMINGHWMNEWRRGISLIFEPFTSLYPPWCHSKWNMNVVIAKYRIFFKYSADIVSNLICTRDTDLSGCQYYATLLYRLIVSCPHHECDNQPSSVVELVFASCTVHHTISW